MLSRKNYQESKLGSKSHKKKFEFYLTQIIFNAGDPFQPLKTYLDSKEDDGAQSHPGVQGVQVGHRLRVSILVLVLKSCFVLF
jgi:hypothetical protein